MDSLRPSIAGMNDLKCSCYFERGPADEMYLPTRAMETPNLQIPFLATGSAGLVTRRETHPKLDMLIKADFLMDLKDWFKTCFSKTVNSSQDVCAGISNS